MSIQRYDARSDADRFDGLVPYDDGEYVKFTDHNMEIASLEVVHEVLIADCRRQAAKMEKRWTDVFGHLGSTPDECGNAIIAKYDQYEVQLIEMEARIDHLASQLKEDNE